MTPGCNLGALASTLDVLELELQAVGVHDQRGRVALFGSAVLARWGLRERVGDVDLFVRPDVWASLSERAGWEVRVGEHPDHPPYLALEVLDDLEVHAFYAWRDDQPEIDAQQAIAMARIAEGWAYTPLELVRFHKRMALHRCVEYGLEPPRKHVDDLELIDRHLEAEASHGRQGRLVGPDRLEREP